MSATTVTGTATPNYPGETVLRSTHQPMRRTTARWSRSLWLLAAFALVVTACGEDDGTVAVEDVADDDVAGSDDATQDTEAAELEEDVDTDTDTDEDVEVVGEDDADAADEVDDDGEHRPSADLRSSIDCSTVVTSSPGATIVFPDSNDPASLQVGAGPVTVEVVGCSDTFEANVQYDAFHGQNTQPTLSGFTQGGTLGTAEEFSFEETYWTAGDWTVVVFVNDAESGNRVEYDQVTFTVD